MNVRKTVRLLTAVPLCLAICLPVACKNKQRGGSSGRGGRGDGYKYVASASAQETAEKFARAWKSRDFAAAKELFSPELKDRYDERKLKDLIVGPPNHEHKDVEISTARQISENRLEFTLRLTILSKGIISDRKQTEEWNIELVRYNSKWLVDYIPVPRQVVPTG